MQMLSSLSWDLGESIATHGYWLLAIGCLLEGETLLLLAGFAAHRGLLDPVAVVVVASVFGFAGDQFYFWLGRRQGARVLEKRPAWARRAARVEALIERWDAAFVIGVRFAYGLRVAGPMLMGASAMSSRRFAIFNALGAVIWALVVGGTGWIFGEAVQRWLGHWHQLEAAFVLVLLVLLLALWLRRRHQAP